MKETKETKGTTFQSWSGENLNSEISSRSCDIADLAMFFAREEVLKVDPNHPLWSKPQYRPELDGSMTEEVQDIFDGLYDEVRDHLDKVKKQALILALVKISEEIVYGVEL